MMSTAEESPRTRPSLLVRLRDELDPKVWEIFVDTYGPVVQGFLRRKGMQDADVLDVTQDVFAAVAAGISRFEHNRHRAGSFRSWLFTIVRNRASDHWRRERRHPRATGDTAAHQSLADLAAEDDALEKQWNRDYLEGLFHSAANQVKGDFQESTWEAFWRTTVGHEPLRQVAADLKISVPGVSMAKRRVLRRIQQQIEVLEGDARDE